MRATLILVLLALGATGLSSTAGGVAPLCAPACEVVSHTNTGFLPPATVVQSGGAVTWSSLDVAGHSASAADLCFHVTYNQGRPGTGVFSVVDGVLYAGVEGGTPKPCPSARVLPDGSVAIDYLCIFHRSSMKGTLVVK